MATNDGSRCLVLAIAFCGLAVAGGRGVRAEARPVAPREAIEQAVSARLGGDVNVLVASLQTTVAAEPRLEAVPEPGARTGTRTRFVLTVGNKRRGIAVAIVKASGRLPRAAQAIARGEVLTTSSIDLRDGELAAALFKRLPDANELVGLSAKRNIAAGETLTAAVVELPPVVRSGDQVTVAVTVGTVHATGEGIASGSGHVGDVVQVLQKGRLRPLKARITGPGTVEVSQ